MNGVKISAVLAFLFHASVAKAEPSPQDLAARTELHAINTLTLSDTQFLAADTSANAATTSGQLRIPRGSGRLPVVVLQHGSGGMGANVEAWAREFNAQGFSTLALDGFTGRGLTQVSTDQALLGRLNFILDIYRSLDILAKHPRVDPERIVLMGFSRGGQAVLYASLKRFHKMWNRSGLAFAAYIPFYPDCMTTFIADTDVAERPIRIFGGMADDYNPIALCKAYADRLKSAGRDVAVTAYPNAPHGFDNPLAAQPAVRSPNSQTVRNCRIQETPAGILVNADTNQPFAYTDSCVERGPHLGHDPEATGQARQAVKAFVASVLKRE